MGPLKRLVPQDKPGPKGNGVTLLVEVHSENSFLAESQQCPLPVSYREGNLEASNCSSSSKAYRMVPSASKCTWGVLEKTALSPITKSYMKISLALGVRNTVMYLDWPQISQRISP